MAKNISMKMMKKAPAKFNDKLKKASEEGKLSGEFKKAVHDILADKINDAVELKKFDVASTFMNAKVTEVPDIEPEESSDETTEV